MALHRVVRTFVSDWIAQCYPDDEAITADAELKLFYDWIAESSQAHAYKLSGEVSRESLVDMLAQFVFCHHRMARACRHRGRAFAVRRRFGHASNGGCHHERSTNVSQ